MVGFISNLAPLLNYLRRRSPGPPFPPDHQAGERGAINILLDTLRDTCLSEPHNIKALYRMSHLRLLAGGLIFCQLIGRLCKKSTHIALECACVPPSDV